VADKERRKRFADAYSEFHRLLNEGEDRVYILAGREEWRLPIPIVKRGNVWQFEILSGIEEMLRGRISSNEDAAVNVCRIYGELQREYSSKTHDSATQPGVYAQKLMSDQGKHNGLYWKVTGHEERSPADTLVEFAMQEGYATPGGRPKPFHGYFFSILTAQGPDAPGGATSYFEEGDRGFFAERRMTRGFALVAFPAKYGSSGVKSFLVSHNGIIYEKDLGQDSLAIGRRMREYNPDATWTPAH